jgi:hypothetical protein
VPAFACNAPLLVEGPVGLLEVFTGCPEVPARNATAIVCHPHSLHGGTMQNKVVTTLAKTFESLGAASVRFNFRGVGKSAGVFDHGVGETQDLLAVAEWVRRERPKDVLWLAGFSFGAVVALRVAGRLNLERLVTVAPAVHLYDLTNLAAPTVPWLLVQGDQDEVVPANAVFEWVRALSQPPALEVLPGVGHYFHQRLHELRDAVLKFYS